MSKLTTSVLITLLLACCSLFMMACKDKVCKVCSGKGKHVCEQCEGARVLKCTICSGEGYTICNRCAGTGKTTTENYEYVSVRGKLTSKMVRKSLNCPNCKHTGKLICVECAGQKHKKCTTCDSVGALICNECMGTGVIKFSLKLDYKK